MLFTLLSPPGIADILEVTVEKNTGFRGSHEHIIASQAAALLLTGLRFKILPASLLI